MKNKTIVVLFIIMFVVIAVNIFIRPLNDLDEIWNFNFAKCISSGNVPYKQINMITTPLSSFIGALALVMFGKELFVMRALASILATTILLIIYKIFRLLKIDRYISMIMTLFICVNYIELFVYDYNFLLILLVLLIIYLEIKNNQYNKASKLNFVIGIVAGLCVITKQTVGSICLVIVLLNNIWLINSRSDLKHYIKTLIIRIVGSSIPITLFICYLLYNGAFGSFLEYCILGISTFNNKISYLNLVLNSDIKLTIMSIVVPTVIIMCAIRNLVKRPKNLKKKNQYILLMYSLSAFVLAFPISDTIHFMIGILPATILIVYWIYCRYGEILSKIQLKWQKVFALYMLILLILFSASSILVSFNNDLVICKLKGFNNIPVNKDLDCEIKNVQNYIINQQDKVYIIDSTASIYFIPLDIYNKDYDLFLIGNVGKNGTNTKIKELCEKENIKILVNSNIENINWQMDKKDIQYVIENKEKVGQIERFDIYE